MEKLWIIKTKLKKNHSGLTQANIKNDYSQKCTKATVEMPYDYDNQF